MVLELLVSLQAPQIPEQLRVRVSNPAPHAELHDPHSPHGLQSPALQASVSKLDPAQPPHVPTHARVRLCVPRPHAGKQLPQGPHWLHD